MLLSFLPHLTADGAAIDWNVPLPINLLRAIPYLVTFIPIGVIWFRQFLHGDDPYTRVRSLGFSLAMGLGVIAISIEFILETVLRFPPISSDIALTAVYILLLISLLIPQRYFYKYMKNSALKNQ